MKKTRFKRLLSLSIVILISSFLLWSCHDEKDFTAEPQAFGLFDLEHRRVSHLENDEIPIHIQDYLYKGTSGTYHVVQSKSKGGFRLSKGQDRSTVFGTIDESTAVAVSLSGQTRYTFLVEPSISNPDELINLIIIDDEVATLEYFIKYEFDSDRQVRTAFDDTDMTQFTGKISYFDGDGTPTGEFTLENGETINSDGSGTPCPPDDSDDPNDPNDPTNDDNDGGAGNGGCTVNCGGDGHDDNTDEPGGGDGGGNGSEICYVEISYGACCNDNTEPHGAEACGCGDGNLNLLTIRTTCQGGSRTADLEPFECDDNDVGVLFGRKKECKKISDFLSDSDNANFKQRLLELGSTTSAEQHLDKDHEISVTIHEFHTEIEERLGQPNAMSVDVSYTATHPNRVKAWVHTQPNGVGVNGSYSVFSYEDLIAMSNWMSTDKMNPDNFVAFLITKKGDNYTHYAMTINNKSKFKKFFSSYQKFDYMSLSDEDIVNLKAAAEKSYGLRDKYYDSDDARIKVQNVDSNIVLREFLSLLDEGDMGVSMFKTDENFDNFTNVTLKNGVINEKPCDQ
jgi:hypothetical protein